MGVGADYGNQSSNSTQYLRSGDLKKFRKPLISTFADYIGRMGPDIFSMPANNALRSIYQNIYGDASPAGAAGGAQGGLMNMLSGGGYGKAFDSAMQQMTPGALEAIRRGNEQIRAQLGSQGNRYGSDMANQFSHNTLQGLQNLTAQAAQTAVPLYQSQLQGMLGVGQQAIDSQQDLLRNFIAMAGNFQPQLGSSSSSGSNYGFNVGWAGRSGKKS